MDHTYHSHMFLSFHTWIIMSPFLQKVVCPVLKYLPSHCRLRRMHPVSPHSATDSHIFV
jgi:hypothetical protein